MNSSLNWLRRSRRCRRQRSRPDSPYLIRGFTFVEILVVVVILSIAAVIAIPMMTSAGGIQAKSAANMIAADLEYAKSMAIGYQQNYSVVFDTANESYEIQNSGGFVIPHPVNIGSDYVVDFQNESRLNKVDIVSATSPVTFDSMGSPSSAATIVVSADGTTKTISVEAITGFISN